MGSATLGSATLLALLLAGGCASPAASPTPGVLLQSSAFAEGEPDVRFQARAGPFHVSTDADEVFFRKLVLTVRAAVKARTDLFPGAAGNPSPAAPLGAEETEMPTPGAHPVRVHVDATRGAFLRAFRVRFGVRATPGAYYGQYRDRTGRLRREVRAYLGNRSHEEALAAVRHEIGHFFTCAFLRNWNPASVPAWIHEGLARLYEAQVAHREGSRTQVALPPARGWSALVARAVGEDRHIPLRILRSVSNDESLALTWINPAQSRLFYAQVWSVMEFLRTRPGKRLGSRPSGPRPFRNFLRHLRAHRGLRADGAFHAAYGGRLEDWEPRWRDYVLEVGSEE